MTVKHPVDESLGNIQYGAILLEMMGHADLVLALATAHERIQSYLIENMEDDDLE